MEQVLLTTPDFLGSFLGDPPAWQNEAGMMMYFMFFYSKNVYLSPGHVSWTEAIG